MDPLWVCVAVMVLGLVTLAVLLAGLALYQVYQVREQQRRLWARLEELGTMRPPVRPVPAERPAAVPPPGVPSVAPAPSAPPAGPAGPSPAEPPVGPPVPPEKVAAFRHYVENVKNVQNEQTVHQAEVAGQPVAPPQPAAVPPPPVVPPPLPAEPPRPVWTAPVEPAPSEPPLVPVSMEAWLGGRVLVWAAAILLAIGGIYLLQLSRGLLKPVVLVTIGALFGAALLGAAQWLRRNNYIAQGLAAAGIAVLFACVLASVNYYRPALLSPSVGFVLMAVITALAVGLSLQLGPLVAALGLIGGFLTPALMQTGEVRPGALFGYLFLLQAGLMAVTRRRGWIILAHLTLLGSMLWVLAFLAFTNAFVHSWNPEHGRILGLFLLGSVITFLAVTVPASAEQAWHGRSLAARVLAWLATSAALLLVVLLLGLSDFEPIQWAFLGLLTLGCMALGRLRPVYENLAWIATTLVLVMLLVWGVRVQEAGAALDLARFAWTIGLLGGTLATAGYLCLWRSASPLRWSVFASAVAVIYLTVAYGVLHGQLTRPQWGLLFLAAAGLTAVASLPLYRSRETMREGTESFSSFALATMTLVALAVMAAFRQAWLTAIWSLLVPPTVYLALRLRTPALLRGAAVLAACVAVRCLANPAVFTYPTGPSLFWNPIVYGYGIPLLAFTAALWMLRREDSWVVVWFEVGPRALAFAFVTLMVRRGFHADNIAELSLLFPEAGTLTVGWLVLGWAFLAASARRSAASAARSAASAGGSAGAPSGVAAARSAVGAGVGGFLVVIGIANLAFSFIQLGRPDWVEGVGQVPVFNLLLYVFGVPTALLLGMGIDLRRRGEIIAEVAHVSGVLALVGLATVEVRHLHHLANLGGMGFTFAEMGSYAVAWLVLGQGLLVAARRGGRSLVQVEGTVLAAAGAAFAILVPGLMLNPRWFGWDVGSGLIFNHLLWTYGGPLALLLLVTFDQRCHGRLAAARGSAVGVLVLLFLLVTLEVRQGFQGAMLNHDWTPAAEMWSYSLAWTILGLLLNVAGLGLGGVVLRWAGLLLILLTIGKALAFDAWQLQGVARVLLLIGLGLALFPLAYLYQRFFLARPERDGAP